MKTYFKSACLD